MGLAIVDKNLFVGPMYDAFSRGIRRICNHEAQPSQLFLFLNLIRPASGPFSSLRRPKLAALPFLGITGSPFVIISSRSQNHNIMVDFLVFELRFWTSQDSLVVISRLDEVSTGASCRLALYGRLTALLDPNSPSEMSQLKVYKVKRKEGIIERLLPQDSRLAVCKGFFKKESDFSPFVGLKVA